MSTEEIRGETVDMTAALTTTENQVPPSSGTTRTQEPNLAGELRELGKQIQAMLSTVRADPRAKEVELQVTNAMRDAEKQVAEALSTLRREMESGRVKDQLKGTAGTAAEQVETGLARGLHGMNERIAKFVQESEQTRKQREATRAQAPASGTPDDEVADRFDKDEPVFGQGMHVPAPDVQVNPTPMTPNEQTGTPAGNTPDTLVNERFDDRPVDFGEQNERQG